MLKPTVKFKIFFKELKCCSDLVGQARLVLLLEETFANNYIMFLLGLMHLPIMGSGYLQNDKIIENPTSTRFSATCLHDYPEKQATLCYKPCEKRSD